MYFLFAKFSKILIKSIYRLQNPLTLCIHSFMKIVEAVSEIQIIYIQVLAVGNRQQEYMCIFSLSSTKNMVNRNI